ncbi:MAG: type IV pilus secretin PilQ family protein [Mycobacterium sp.]
MTVQDFVLRSPNRVVVDVAGAHLGSAPREYDRVARGGIINVRFSQYRGSMVRVVINLDAPRAYEVTRSSDGIRFAIDGQSASFGPWHSATPSREAAPAPARETARSADLDTRADESPRAVARSLAAAPQPRITVTYQDADIRDVLAAFAAFSGRTIVAGKGVDGKVTAEVRDQPWDIAMQAILQAQGLAAAEDVNGIITVDSYGALLAKQATEPLETQIVRLSYARAASLVIVIEKQLSKDCPVNDKGITQSGGCAARGSVVADTSTNALIITEAPTRMKTVLSYVKDLDSRTPLVAIKSKIIFINRSSLTDIGLTYDLGSQTQFFNRLVQRFDRTDPSTFKAVDGTGSGVPNMLVPTKKYDPNTYQVDLGGSQLAALANANQRVTNPALQLIFSTALGNFNLTTFLDALQEVSLADVQAEPSIVTLDNKKAEILVGEETPIRVVDASSSTTGGGAPARATVSFKETGIILSVTPHVTNNGQIKMTLHSERSNLETAPSDLGYTFRKQRADNELLVSDGETAVIGGLTVTQVTVSKSGIPLLVDLPLVGRFFGDTKTQETRQDLLILVTPHIVEQSDRVGGQQGAR